MPASRVRHGPSQSLPVHMEIIDYVSKAKYPTRVTESHFSINFFHFLFNFCLFSSKSYQGSYVDQGCPQGKVTLATLSDYTLKRTSIGSNVVVTS